MKNYIIWILTMLSPRKLDLIEILNYIKLKIIYLEHKN